MIAVGLEKCLNNFMLFEIIFKYVKNKAFEPRCVGVCSWMSLWKRPWEVFKIFRTIIIYVHNLVLELYLIGICSSTCI